VRAAQMRQLLKNSAILYVNCCIFRSWFWQSWPRNSRDVCGERSFITMVKRTYCGRCLHQVQSTR